MKVGYIRVSRHEQNKVLQEDALHAAGCERIFYDIGVSGVKAERPGLDAALGFLRPGDILVVWKLDRAGRSLKNLIELFEKFSERGIEFVSLTELIDTSTPGGKLIFHMMAALAEFERALTIERTQAGLAAARARGRKGGRPKAIEKMEPRNLARAKELYDAKQNTVDEIMRMTGFKSRNSFYKYVVYGETVEASAPSPDTRKKRSKKA